MGKITVRGSAERELSYNEVELSLTFHCHAETTSQALHGITEQCERFLERIKAAGVNMKDIRVGDHSIDQSYNHKKTTVCADKEIKMRLDFDMAFINGIMNLIKEQDFAIEFDCDYHLTNKKEIHDELLKEALADSRKKAEFMADAIGQKVVGIDSIDYSGYCEDFTISCKYAAGGLALPNRTPLLSDQLEAPFTTENESVTVSWLIE